MDDEYVDVDDTGASQPDTTATGRPRRAAAARRFNTPGYDDDYEEDDSLAQGRSMGNMILLPTGKIVYLNGAADGVAGYGNDSWAIGASYANNAILQPMLYDPDAPAGQRWSTGGFGQSTVARMYHSSATLLPDGASKV